MKLSPKIAWPFFPTDKNELLPMEHLPLNVIDPFISNLTPLLGYILTIFWPRRIIPNTSVH
jgi:hypothetical protein